MGSNLSRCHFFGQFVYFQFVNFFWTTRMRFQPVNFITSKIITTAMWNAQFPPLMHEARAKASGRKRKSCIPRTALMTFIIMMMIMMIMVKRITNKSHKKKSSMTAEMSLCQLFQSSSPTCTTAFVFCWVKKRVRASQKQRNKEQSKASGCEGRQNKCERS